MLALLLALCLALGCTACGGGAGGASAAGMFLRKTEGADIAPAENLGLYSGCTAGTEAESCAWIDLGKVKLAKLNENSAVEITKVVYSETVDFEADGSPELLVIQPGWVSRHNEKSLVDDMNDTMDWEEQAACLSQYNDTPVRGLYATNPAS